MNVRNILLLLCISVSVIAHGQDKYTCPETSNVLIQPDKPNVYLAYVRSKELPVANNSLKRTFYYLRLQNNSKWAIAINAVPGVSAPENSLRTQKLCSGTKEVLVTETEVEINYDVEPQNIEAKPRPKIMINSLLHWVIWLAPGDALQFKVSDQDLNEDYSIKVLFTYEWEMMNRPQPKSYDRKDIAKYYEDLTSYEGPLHTLYFRHFKIKEQLEK